MEASLCLPSPSIFTILTIILLRQWLLTTFCTSSLATPKIILITRPCKVTHLRLRPSSVG